MRIVASNFYLQKIHFSRGQSSLIEGTIDNFVNNQSISVYSTNYFVIKLLKLLREAKVDFRLNYFIEEIAANKIIKKEYNLTINNSNGILVPEEIMITLAKESQGNTKGPTLLDLKSNEFILRNIQRPPIRHKHKAKDLSDVYQSLNFFSGYDNLQPLHIILKKHYELFKLYVHYGLTENEARKQSLLDDNIKFEICKSLFD